MPYDYETLTPKEKKRLGRTTRWHGADEGSKLLQLYMMQKEAEKQGAGTEAIQRIEEGKKQSLGYGQEVDALRRKMSSVTPEEQTRLDKSRPMLEEHIGTLQGKQKPYEQLVQEEVSEKGLSEVPQVKTYLEGQRGLRETEATQQRQETIQTGVEQFADKYEQTDPTAADAMRLLSKVLPESALKQVEEVLKNSLARGLETQKQEGRVEEEELVQKGGIELEELKGEQRMELEQFKSAEREQLEGIKALAKEGKKETDQQDINNGIEAVLALAEGVPPSHRLVGFMAKVGKWSGFNPNLASLDNTAGLLAGQVAKKIGGESGRLTDQDRLYALRVMPKSIDSKKEREIKVAVLRAFQDSRVDGASIRARLIAAMGNLNSIDPQRYEIIHEIKDDEEYDRLPSGSSFIGPDGIERRKP